MPGETGAGGNRTPGQILVMGVAGSGKSTLAQALSERLGWTLLEGDDLHPPGNIAKMTAAVPLTDADRRPWLAAIAVRMAELGAVGRGVVAACSALKRSYREQLRGACPGLQIVHIRGDRDLVAQRLAGRSGHFMPPQLLDSQFAALQPPGPDEGAFEVSAALSVREQVDQVLTALSGP